MARDNASTSRPRFWIVLIGIIILLIFLYFYQPLEIYLSENIPQIRSSTVIFWFASLVGVIVYAIAHWQSYRRNIFRAVTNLEVEGLVFDTLQAAILVAVIFFAGATLQVIEMLSEHLINRGPIIGPEFGRMLLAIILLVILAIAFYLLHRAVRSFRVGWRPGRQPPRTSGPGGSS